MADTQDKVEKLEVFHRPAAEYWHAMVRFFILANAGGAVTVISFLGASSNANHGSWLALVPLGFFFIGMVSAGIAAISGAGQALYNAVMAADRILGDQPEPPKVMALVLALRRVSPWPELLAFVFFILGGLSGLVFLGILLTASDGTAPAPSAAVVG